jgi:hypothetical protein
MPPETQALLFPPKEQPRYVALTPTLDNLQTIVEGDIELLTIPEEPTAIAIVNTNAKLWNLPSNHYASRRLYTYDELQGPVVILGEPTLTDDAISFKPVPPLLAAYYIGRCNVEAEKDPPSAAGGG